MHANTALLVPFLNRAGDAFDPAAWFQLVPRGTFPIARKEGDVVRTYQQVVDELACDRIVAAFQNRQAKAPAYKLLVGFEHFAHQPNGSSEAACWVDQMEKRADGVWARGDWTPDGAAAITNRKYRFLSPVWFPRQTEPISGNRFRPVEVNDAGLTNMPNLGDALQPFWNRMEEFHGREATTAEPTKNQAMKDRLIALFKMPAASTEDEVFAKATAFLNRASEADTLQGTVTTLTTDHTALKNRHATLLATTVERTLDEYKGVITAESIDAWKNRLTADLDGTVALLKGIKAPAAAAKKPLHQAGKGAAAAAAAHADTTGEDGDAFMNRVAEVVTERKVSEADAQVLVARENPELYEGYRARLFREAGE